MLQIMLQTINGYIMNFMSRFNIRLDPKKYVMTITISSMNEVGNRVTVTNTISRNGREVIHSEGLVVDGHHEAYVQGKTTLAPPKTDVEEVVPAEAETEVEEAVTPVEETPKKKAKK